MMALRVDSFPYSLPAKKPSWKKEKNRLTLSHYYLLHSFAKAEREGQLRLTRAEVRRELITLDSGVTGPLSRRRIARDTQRSAAASGLPRTDFFFYNADEEI